MPVTERTVSLKTVQDAVIVDLDSLKQQFNTIKEAEDVYHDFQSKLSDLTSDSANELVVDGNDILKTYFDSLLEEFSYVVNVFDAIDVSEVTRTAKNGNLGILKSKYDQADAIYRQDSQIINDKNLSKAYDVDALDKEQGRALADMSTCDKLMEENRV